MASLERQTSRVSALKGQFEALSAEGRQNLLKETERVRALFKKYDTDASGTIDAHEFHVLAFDLGLVLTDQEAKNFVQELDTDGNGTVDFAEFLTWWNNPDKKVVGTENQNRLKMLKLRLRSQSALAAASAITNSLAKKVEATKPEAESAEPPQKDQSTFSVKVNIGQFDAPRSSLALTYANAADKAEAIRQVTKAGENALAVTLRLAIKQGVDLFEVGEVSSAIKGVLSLAKKKLKYSDVATKMEKVDGQDVLALSFAFEPAEVELLPELSQLFGALEFSKLEVKAEASERPGDAPSPQGLAVRLSTSLAFNRKAMQALYEQDEHSNRNPIRKGMALANALRNVALVVESENISHFIKKEFNTAKVGEDVNSFATLQSKLIFPALAGILANDELPAAITDLYASCLKVLSDVHGIQVAIGPHVFEVATSGLHLFDSSYFPSRDDLKKWVVEQEEEKKRRELEKEKALEEKLKRFWEDLDD